MTAYEQMVLAPVSQEEAESMAAYIKACNMPHPFGRDMKMFLCGWRVAFIAQNELKKAKETGNFIQGQGRLKGGN